jgi:hypothetical protein
VGRERAEKLEAACKEHSCPASMVASTAARPCNETLLLGGVPAGFHGFYIRTLTLPLVGLGKEPLLGITTWK